jgi:ribose-phosphate pyrophosphokinase
MNVQVQAFADQAAPARALAGELGVSFALIDLHRFPDGELMPTAPSPAPHTVIFYHSLDHPSDKLIALLLACDAWRRQGVERIVLVCPYLCYMRQDTVFAPGQSLSRDVICPLIGAQVDRVVTVDCHLHRTGRLSDAFGATRAEDLSAAAPLALALQRDEPSVVVGPDEESRPWAARIAELLNAPVMVARKERSGDFDVALASAHMNEVAGKRAVIVDDICSSGATLIEAARQALAAGASAVDLGVVHALFGPEVEAALRRAGVRRILSTDAVIHSTNAAALAKPLAEALSDEIAP